MGIATFAGIFAANNRWTYCGNKNLLNALRRGNKHTGVLWLSASLIFYFQNTNLKQIKKMKHKLFTEQQLLEIYDLVFSSTHSNGFKTSEIKDLLFESDYWFLEKPKENWKSDLINYLDSNGIDKSNLNANKALISF